MASSACTARSSSTGEQGSETRFSESSRLRAAASPEGEAKEGC